MKEEEKEIDDNRKLDEVSFSKEVMEEFHPIRSRCVIPGASWQAGVDMFREVFYE